MVQSGIYTRIYNVRVFNHRDFSTGTYHHTMPSYGFYQHITSLVNGGEASPQ